MKLIRFLVFSNLWISAGSSCLTFLTFYFLDTEPNIKLILFVFFATLFSYNFQRLSRLQKLKENSPELWITTHSTEGKIILTLALLGALFFNPVFEKPFLLIPLALLGAVSFSYSYKKLRDIPMLKIFLIAASWGILCGLTPFFYSPFWGSVSWIQSFSWIFFYILAITIPFDIRDIHIDEADKNTLPQLLGVKKSKNLALIFLAVSFLCIFTFSSSSLSVFFLFSFILAGILILKSNPTNKPLYFALLVDGHIILQFLGVYFFG